MDHIPDFPDRAGEDHAIEFVKDGNTYRSLRTNNGDILIHRRGATPDEFELLITNFSADHRHFDVFGQGSIAHVTGRDADLRLLAKLF